MKIKLEDKYKKVIAAVVIAFLIIYVSKYIIDFIAIVLSNATEASNKINAFFGIIFDVFFPLILGFIWAFLLDPLCDKIQRSYEKKKGVKYKVLNDEKKFRTRGFGTLIIYIVFFIIVGAGIFAIVGSFTFTTPKDLIHTIQTNVDSTVESMNQIYDNIVAWLTEVGLIDYFRGILDAVFTFAKALASGIFSIVLKIISALFSFFLALVFGFYILKDKEEFLYKTDVVFDTFVPTKAYKKMKNVVHNINTIFSGFIRGQITDALIVGTLLSIILSVLNIPFAVLIGVISGFSNLIPYVGAFVAFILAMVSALTSGNPISALWAAIGILIVQQIDSIYIVPNVVGKNVELSPFVVLLSLTLAGSLFGIIGMVLAVPVTALFKILWLKILESQRNSKKIKNALTLEKNKEHTEA